MEIFVCLIGGWLYIHSFCPGMPLQYLCNSQCRPKQCYALKSVALEGYNSAEGSTVRHSVVISGIALTEYRACRNYVCADMASLGALSSCEILLICCIMH